MLRMDDMSRQEITTMIAEYIYANTDEGQLSEDDIKLLSEGIVSKLFGDDE